jgi:branched-chain amino acid transport system substrate-binding protein
MQRQRLAIGLASILALLAAACAGDDSDSDTEAGGDDSDGDLGSVTIGPDDPLLVGSIQSISGDNASLGVDQVRAIEIAIADRDGELLGHEIELQSEDGECTADGGTATAQRLAGEPQVTAVIGTSCSGAGVPASDILTDAGIVLISSSNTSPALTSDLEGTAGESYNEGYFRVAHNDIYQGEAAAVYAYEELGATRAATVHDGDPYTEGLATSFGNAFEELGGEVVEATAVGPDDTDMHPVLTDIAAAEPDILFFPIFQPAGDHIAAQAKEFDELADPEMLMSADALLSDTFVELPDTEGMYFSGPGTPEGPDYEEFVDKYEAEFGEPPIQAFHARAYDTANLLFDTIEQVAEEADDGTITLDRRALIDALFEVEGFEGLTGSLTCDDFGDCANPIIDIVHNTEDAVTIDEIRANVQYTWEPEE